MADRKITDLTALAAGSQATGDLLTIVDVSEAAATDKNKKITVESLFKGIPGDVGIGTSSPSTNLEVSRTGNNPQGLSLTATDVTLSPRLFFESTSTNNAPCLFGNDGDLVIHSGATPGSSSGTERMRIDSSGRLLLGTDTGRLVNNHNMRFQQFGTDNAGSRMAIFRSSNDNGGSGLHLCKSRGTAGDVVVNSGDQVGILAFNVYDGTNFQHQCASIEADIDTTPGVDDVPGRLIFSTTPSGASSPSERMRIDNGGKVLIGTTSVLESSSAAKLHIAHTSGALIALGRNDSAVTDGNDMGKIAFYGNDGGAYEKVAQILCEADGSHASGDKPGRLMFQTTADSASSPTERLRIDSTGNVKARRARSNNSGDVALSIHPSDTTVNYGFRIDGATNSFNLDRVDNSSTLLRIASNGDVGIGIASAAQKLQVHESASSTESYVHITNAVSGSTSSDGLLVGLDTSANAILWNMDNTVLKFATNNTERMRIDTSGRLFIGTTSELISGAEKKLQMTHTNAGAEIVLGRNDSSVADGNSLGAIKFVGNDGGTYQQCAKIEAIADGSHANNDKPTRLVFSTTADNGSSPTERMRIANSGLSDIYGSSSTLRLRTGLTGTSGQLLGGFNGATSISNGTQSLAIFANGNVQNTNNSYSQLSDVKLKENIVDANSQWDDLKAIQIRNWNFKAETGYETHTQIGVVAQEIETVSPGLVYDTPDRDDEGNDLGTVTKSVNYSVLYVKAIKALQEAQTRIEALEAQHADLLARVTALEAG